MITPKDNLLPLLSDDIDQTNDDGTYCIIIVLCFAHNLNAKKLYSTSARSIPAVPSAYLAELHYF